MTTFGGRVARLLFVFLYCFAPGLAPGAEPISSSDYAIDTYTRQHGLPQSSVTAIAQTPEGYLWFGTFNGLARFDGVRFAVFDTTNTPGLGGKRIMRLFVDRAGRLWIVTEEGPVSCLKDGVFQSAPGSENKLGQRTLFAEDRRGNLWLINSYEIHRRDGQRLIRLPSPEGLPEEWIQRAACDAQGQLWVYLQASQQLGRIDNGRFVAVEIGKGNALGEIFPSRKEWLWLFTSFGFRRLGPDGSMTAFATGALPASHSTCALEDRAGNIWLGTFAGGIACIGPDGQTELISARHGLGNNSIRALFEDREGNIWAGTDGGGVSRLKKRAFQVFDPRPEDGGTIVHSLWPARDGGLWVATSGQGVLHLKDGAFTPLKGQSGMELPKYPWCVTEDATGVLWVGAYSEGVFRIGHEGVTATRLDHWVNYINTALLVDRQNRVWLGNEGGLYRFDDGRWNPIPLTNLFLSVRAIAEDRQGRIWIGSKLGLFCLEGSEARHFERRHGLPANSIYSLYADREGVLWIGTFGGGLSRLKDGRFTNYTEDNGLYDRDIYAIFEEANGWFWMASNRGVFRVRRTELDEFAAGRRRSITCLGYTEASGLRTRECTGGAQPKICQTADGALWFPTAQGVAAVNPRDLALNTNPPPVAIEEVFVDSSQIVSNWSAAAAPVIRVPSGNRRLEIRYTALSFSAPERVQFKYQLENFDRDWIEVGTRRAAYFQGLRPGTYRFRVIAANNDGVWNESGAVLAVTVLPAFWQTGWFAAGAVVFLGGLLAAGYRYRMSRLAEVARLRLRIAGDLHDEIGANLGSIALNAELLENSPSLAEPDRRELGEINRVALQTAQHVRDIAWFINPDFDNLPEMIARMEEVARAMLAGREITFLEPASTTARPLSLEFRRNIFFVFKEVLHNILKHSDATRVRIELSDQNGLFELHVEDNGKGFDPAAIQKGQGLKSLRRRAAELGADLDLGSRPGEGTSVRIRARM